MEQKSLMKDTGEGRIDVAFTRDIRIKWDWNDLLEDAVTAEENLNLTVAGLVLSRNAEISGRTLEKTMRQLGFERIVSDNYLLSTETRNAVSKPARTFGYKEIEKDGKTYWYSRAIVCVSAVFCKDKNLNTYVLANQRGTATDKEVGKWNLPVGFLDFNETCS